MGDESYDEGYRDGSVDDGEAINLKKSTSLVNFQDVGSDEVMAVIDETPTESVKSLRKTISLTFQNSIMTPIEREKILERERERLEREKEREKLEREKIVPSSSEPAIATVAPDGQNKKTLQKRGLLRKFSLSNSSSSTSSEDYEKDKDKDKDKDKEKEGKEKEKEGGGGSFIKTGFLSSITQHFNSSHQSHQSSPPNSPSGTERNKHFEYRPDTLNLVQCIGQLLIRIVGAKDLAPPAKKGVPMVVNPYCKVVVNGYDNTKLKAKTATIFKQSNPQWNETITLFTDLSSTTLEVFVYTRAESFNKGETKTLLGRNFIDLNPFNNVVDSETPATLDIWLPLSEGTSVEGSVKVSILYRRLRESPSVQEKDIYGFNVEPSVVNEYWETMRHYYKKLESRRKEFDKSGWRKFKDNKEFRSWARKGFPAEHRGEIWQIISGSKEKLRKNSDYYAIILDQHKTEETIHSLQIDKDLDRTFPHHLLFKANSGRASLRRVLRAFSFKNQSIGYCQSMNFFCGVLLLLMDEEAVFWTLATITEELLPDYFNMNMLGVKAEVGVFKDLAYRTFPKLMAVFDANDFDISTVTTKWFLCLFAGHLPTETLLRVFDIFLITGTRALHQIALALLKLNEATLLQCSSMEDCYMIATMMAAKAVDADKLIKTAKEIPLMPKAKLKALKEAHFKKEKEHKQNSVFQEILSQTDYSAKELESLSRQFNSLVGITPDNQNLLMNLDTFVQVIISLVKSKEWNAQKEEEMTTLLTHIFHGLDQNCDGNIDFQEFTIAIHTLRRGTHGQKISLAFSAFGNLDAEGVRWMLDVMGHTVKLEEETKEEIFKTLIHEGETKIELPAFKERVASLPILESWLLELTTIPE